MRILIYDKNKNDIEKLTNILSLYPIEMQCDIPSSYNACIDLYKMYTYGIVFIDFKYKTGKKLLKFILNDNSKQRIITISDVCECSEKLGCDFCKKNYHKGRILKPVIQSDITKVLTNKYICQKYSNDVLLMQLKQVEKQVIELYYDFYFDLKCLTFFDNNIAKYGNGFFFIIEKLDEHKIKYSVDLNSNIKVDFSQ